MTADLAADLAAVLGEHLGRPVGVEGLRRLSGGTSHETWGFTLSSGETADTELVLRREFTQGTLDTDVRSEFELLSALYSAGVAVPGPWLYADVDSPLGLPFMVMTRAEGTDLRKDLARAGAGRDRAALAARAVAVQAAIHAVPVAALPTLPGPDGTPGAGRELRRWCAVIETAKAHLEPLLATALTWLRVHEPPAVAPVLVHADFKANNLLISPAGELTVLDWEMAHLGDPVEDLAWTMLWRTEWDITGGLTTAEDYVAAYTALTRRQVEPATLLWWRVFSLVKLWAIFLTGMAGASPRPTLRLMGRATVWLADEIARELLATEGGS